MSKNKIFNWTNPDNGRYYIILLYPDAAQWVIAKAWGGRKRKGGIKTMKFTCHRDAVAKLQAMNQRRTQHGYQLAIS